MVVDMPTFKTSKGERRKFSNEQLQLALDSCLLRGNSVCKAAKDHGIPRTTLWRYVERSKRNSVSLPEKLSMVTKQVPVQLLIRVLKVMNLNIACVYPAS